MSGDIRSKVTIHMVASLDGFISKHDNSFDWMHSNDVYDKGIVLTEEDMAAFNEKIDCYVMGSVTYEQALSLGWPYGSKPVFVISNRDLKTDRDSVSFFSGDLNELIHKNLKLNYANIWMVGGAKLTKTFLQQDLADEIVFTILPVLLGEGTLFFDFIGVERRLHLIDVTAFKDGMVEMTYEIIQS